MPYAVGDIVYALFPFQEGTETKDRPTLVLVADLPLDTALVCMITKQGGHLDMCVPITKTDLDFGQMEVDPSFVRPFRVATIPTNVMRKKEGQAKPEFVQKIKDIIRRKLE